MGLFGLTKSPQDKSKGVSLIVNQIEKQRARKRIPKVLFIMLVAIAMVAASAVAVQWATLRDDFDIPTQDEIFGDDSNEQGSGDKTPEENLRDYDVALILTGKLVSRGEGADETVRWSLVSQDFQTSKGHIADPDALTYYDHKLGGRPMCEDGRVFDNSMTVYYPDGKQSQGQPFCHGVRHGETKQYRVTFYGQSHGFGSYRYKGVFVDGDVDFCNWGFSKCWKYYERAYDAEFKLEKKSGWTWF